MNLNQLGLDSEQRNQLQALLGDNPKLRALLSDHETPVDQALRILSIVRAFDEQTYEDVCRKFDPTLPAFAEIVGHANVQPVPRAERKYWLRGGAQSYWDTYWSQHRDEYEAWAGRFVLWLEDNNQDPVEQLALLLRFNVVKALRLLEGEFEKANANDDLSLCHSLTRQVEANMSMIDPELRPKFEAIVARYRGRAWFLREFNRTAGYFPRSALEDEFHEFVDGDGAKWIFYLSALGGMGKTMFVHHMIARELLKNPPFCLVARIDMDDVEVLEIAKAPWLAAIEIAEALDEQLAVRMFSQGGDYLADVRPFSPLLYRRGTHRGRTLTDYERYSLRALASERFSHWHTLISYCMELPSGRPLIIFIDTIEEASLHWPVEFRRLLDRFKELREKAPQLRLILSGRYPPSPEDAPETDRHFREYDEELRAQTSFARLEPLTNEEARDFIRLQLPKTVDSLANVMIAAAAKNPFKLNMLCEIIASNPDMSADKLKEYGPNVDLAYLIERVVARIPVATELGLRWVLRYGAVPRRLTFSFLQDVLRPLLIDALNGKIEEAGDDIPSPQERETWLTNADTKLEPEQLWEHLSRYASERSWISLQSNDPKTATLHPDVILPMRRLLRKQPIFIRIHHRAVDHFKSLRAQQTENWVELTLGWFYHRLQIGEDNMHRALTTALDERASPDDVADRLEVLREILRTSGDFSDAPAAFLARAHYEVADAIAIEGSFDYLPRDSRRDDIQRHLQKAFEFNQKSDDELPEFAFKWRDFVDRNIPDAWSVVFDLLRSMASSHNRPRYWLLLTEVFAQGKFSQWVFTILTVAFGVSLGRVQSARIPAWAVVEHVAYAYKRRGFLRRAETILRQVQAMIPKEGKPFERVQTNLIEMLVESGRLPEAEKEMNETDRLTQDLSQERLLLRIEICLRRRDAWSALALLDTLVDKTHFRFDRLRGRALGQLLRIDEASAAFAEAKQTVLKSETPTLIDDILCDELHFRLFEAGLATEPTSARNAPIGAAAELELIRAFQLRDNASACQKIIEDLTNSRHSAFMRARATLAGVTWGLLSPKSLDSDFLEWLDAVGGAAKRLRLLEPPVLFGQIELWGVSAWKRLLLRVRFRTAGGETERMDKIALGRAFLAMGDRERADAAFSGVKVETGANAADLAVFRQRCLSDPRAPFRPVAFWQGLASEPGLFVAAVLENADRALRGRDLVIAGECLAAAEKAVPTNVLHPIFAERRRVAQVAFDKVARTTQTSTVTIDTYGANNKVAQATQSTVVTIDADGANSDDGATLADYHCLLISADAERVSIEAAGRERRLLSTVENDSLSILTQFTRERTPRRLTPRFVSGWPEITAELREPFEETLRLPSKRYGILALALVGPSFVAVPWELSIPPSHLPVRIGSARDGGLVAEEIRRAGQRSRTAQTLSDLARRSWSRPRIASCSPPSALSRWPALSIAMERLLEEIRPFDDNDPSVADVIIIISDVEDRPSLLEPCLPGGVTGEMLGREIQRGRQSKQAPCVVMHTPLPTSLSEGINMIFARNQFAQALLNSGAVSSVLATSDAPDNADLGLWRNALRWPNGAGNELDFFGSLRWRELKGVGSRSAGLRESLGFPASALFVNFTPGLTQ